MIARTGIMVWCTLCCGISLAEPTGGARVVRSLDGPWQFQREGAGDAWKEVELPANFEEHEGIEFDGVGVYRKELPWFDLPAGMRAMIHFRAVATLAEVTWNGQPVGSHLGGWTPFRVDITEQVRGAEPGRSHELVVRVDEMVGHNSQGFLPVFAPHFGGIWQSVELLLVPEAWIDDLRLLVTGDVESGALRLEVPLAVTEACPDSRVQARYRMLGDADWSAWYRAPAAEHHANPAFQNAPASARSDLSDLSDASDDPRIIYHLKIPVDDWQAWSPASPRLYEVDIKAISVNRDGSTRSDRVRARGAFRSMRVDGHRLLLNDRPLSVRGLLNWGYAPPRVAPSIDEAHYRAELELARSLGFNLMKFCLWVPPKRYLELADEMGMLAWMEYPTWHSKWTPDQLPTLEPEFTEFFQYDRNHPSVVLRSLTCETGPSADLGVIQALYDRCHAMVPDAVVVDDSSWIGWNRVHDFYDDHPYGNNHTWVATLDRLKQHIAERTAKPLVLGEAIAADTWPDHSELLSAVGDERPFWLPRFLDGDLNWMRRMGEVAGHDSVEYLRADSKHYGLLMRKYQIEAYRREVPFGGYVVSVIRDIPLCSMGFVDYLGRPKWSPDQWSWHGDTMLLLKTDDDRRGFASGQVLRAQLYVSHFGDEPISEGQLTVTVRSDRKNGWQPTARKVLSFHQAGLYPLEPWEVELPDVTRAERFTLAAQLVVGDTTFANEWGLWVLPESVPVASQPVVWHDSLSEEVRQLFPEATPLGDEPSAGVIVTARLDAPLIDHMQAGGRVLVLPDGESGSLPLRDEWFLRGAPHIAEHPSLREVPRQLFVELQHFDLAGPVIPDIAYLEEISPILTLWNNHDLDHVKTQGLVFETRVGAGRMLVSALRHTPDANAAGKWLARVLLEHLAAGPPPAQALSENTVRIMRAKMDERRINLTETSWLFRPDPSNQGLTDGWHLATHQPDDAWKPIQIGRAWEAQGYPTLDGWAWYRIEVDLPAEWAGREAFVSFEGVDDYYELFVNGQKIGTGGDLETKTTAFDERKSHEVTGRLIAGQRNLIAVRVYDWYGAGGIFRPVHIGTVPFGGAELLR